MAIWRKIPILRLSLIITGRSPTLFAIGSATDQDAEVLTKKYPTTLDAFNRTIGDRCNDNFSEYDYIQSRPADYDVEQMRKSKSEHIEDDRSNNCEEYEYLCDLQTRFHD